MIKTKQIAQKILFEAGEYLLKNFYSLKKKGFSKKAPHDLVTEVDLNSEKIFIQQLKKYFPKFNIISEERGEVNKNSAYTWIIDPLDGTSNFVMGNPLFAAVLSLWHKKDNVLTFIWAPYLKELYWAEKNNGAFVNKKRMCVSNKKELKKSFLTFCHGNEINNINKTKTYYSKLKTAGLDFRQLGSSGLEMAFVAAGKTDGHIIPGGKIWDAGAGALLVREAGGKVTDFKNNEWKWGINDYLASNGKIHQQFLKAIKK